MLKEKIWGFAFCIAGIGIFFVYGIKVINTSIITYDEGYNATVAANLMRYGNYRVSYPDNYTFYNIITTGSTVLVPTALLYKIAGINLLTTSIVPLIYGSCSIFLMYCFLAISLRNIHYKYIFASTILLFAIFRDNNFWYCSTHLIGESAAIFFLMICFLPMSLYAIKKEAKYYFISGLGLVAALLTKSSMIFFGVTVLGILFVETLVIRSIDKKVWKCFLGGAVCALCLIDSIKLVQLGRLQKYLLWYKSEWANMLNQSSGIDVAYPFSQKIDTITALFGHHVIICIVAIIFPAIVYLLRVIFILMKKRALITNARFAGLIYAGTGGSSLLVYYIILGGDGLSYARRLSVNALFVKLFCYAFAFVCTFYCIKMIIKKTKSEEFFNKKIIKRGISLTVLLLSAVTFFNAYNLVKVRYEGTHVGKYYLGNMKRFLEEVNMLPKQATIYTMGWWQEPNITLFLDRKMTDINSVTPDSIDRGNGYFIIGNFYSGFTSTDIEKQWNITLHKINEIVMEKEYQEGFVGDESYSIYKIESIK